MVQRFPRPYARYASAALLVAGLCAGSAFAQTKQTEPGAFEKSAASGFYGVVGFKFHDGSTLSPIRIHYRTIGAPHVDVHGQIDNAVLLLHGTGQSSSEFLASSFADPLFRRGEPLDAARYFIIMPDSIGHGQSSKPSDGLRTRFPHYDYTDMVQLQHRLVHDRLGVTRLRLILGTSMGCMNTYLWGETWPGVSRALMTMSCSPFPVAGENWFWREAMIKAIETDPDWDGGNYTSPPKAAIRTVAVISAIATSGAPRLAAMYPTQSSVDEYDARRVATADTTLDVNDTLYQFSASTGYDAWPNLDRITVPVEWWDSADDFINPPTLPYPAATLRRMPENFRYTLLPASAETSGHLTYEMSRYFSADIADLLARSAP